MAAGNHEDAPARARDDDSASNDTAINTNRPTVVIGGAPCRIEIGTNLGVYTSFEEQMILSAALTFTSTTESFLATMNRLHGVRRLARLSLSRSLGHLVK